MAKIRTHYDNLKVARNAPDSVIKAAYKALCQQYHPDKFQGSKEEGERVIKIVKASYEVLIDPAKRTIHDRWIDKQEAKDKQQPRDAKTFETGAKPKQHNNKTEYDETTQTSKPYHHRQDLHNTPIIKEKSSNLVLWLIGSWVIVVVLNKCVSSLPESKNTPYINTTTAPRVQTERTQQPVTKINHPEQPLPQTGANNANFNNGVAPLKIRTSSSGGYHYLVKIVNILTNQPIGSYFIRSGDTLDINIPLGTYEIRYATGTKWQGLDYLFGSETIYSKADSTFNFSFDGYQYTGYTVELIMQQNGNLRTSEIQPSQF